MTYSGEEGTAMGVNALADAKIAAAARNSFAMVAFVFCGVGSGFSYGGCARSVGGNMMLHLLSLLQC